MAQCWLSAHRSVSTSAHHLHKTSRMEILLCSSPQRSTFVKRHRTCTHSQGPKTIRPVLYRNKSLQEQIWVSKWSAAQHQLLVKTTDIWFLCWYYYKWPEMFIPSTGTLLGKKKKMFQSKWMVSHNCQGETQNVLQLWDQQKINWTRDMKRYLHRWNLPCLPLWVSAQQRPEPALLVCTPSSNLLSSSCIGLNRNIHRILNTCMKLPVSAVQCEDRVQGYQMLWCSSRQASDFMALQPLHPTSTSLTDISLATVGTSVGICKTAVRSKLITSLKVSLEQGLSSC